MLELFYPDSKWKIRVFSVRIRKQRNSSQEPSRAGWENEKARLTDVIFFVSLIASVVFTVNNSCSGGKNHFSCRFCPCQQQSTLRETKFGLLKSTETGTNNSLIDNNYFNIDIVACSRQHKYHPLRHTGDSIPWTEVDIGRPWIAVSTKPRCPPSPSTRRIRIRSMGHLRSDERGKLRGIEPEENWNPVDVCLLNISLLIP